MSFQSGPESTYAQPELYAKSTGERAIAPRTTAHASLRTNGKGFEPENARHGEDLPPARQADLSSSIT